MEIRGGSHGVNTRRIRRGVTPAPHAGYVPTTDPERELYAALERLKVERPRYINLEDMERKAAVGSAYDTSMLVYLDTMRLRHFAGIRKPGYRSLMIELFTSYTYPEGGILEFSVNGTRHQFMQADIEDAFGFDGRYRYEPDYTNYPRTGFWGTITHPVFSSKCPVSSIMSDGLYGVYTFFARAFLGKAEATNVANGLYLLWATLNGHAHLTQVYSFLPLSFERIRYADRKTRAPLAHGAFITTLAERVGWTLGPNEIVYEPKVLGLQHQDDPNTHRTRRLGQPERPIPIDDDAERETEEFAQAEQGDAAWEVEAVEHDYAEYMPLGNWSIGSTSQAYTPGYTAGSPFEQVILDLLTGIEEEQRLLREDM